MPTLSFDGTLDGWRAAARAALATRLAPQDVVWQSADDVQGGLALDAPAAAPAQERTQGSVRAHPAPHASVPRRFLSIAALVACHRDRERWATLYRVLWRLTHGGEPHLLAIAIDPDVLHLTRMAKAINREVHKMHAFVRFRLVRAADGADEYVAWFEPEHDVVERSAALFVRRFANMRWAILTPRTSVRWDGTTLAVGPGVPRHEAPSADALERLWGTYYAHIFNPARVKLHAMQSEMPKRYWRNLPEAPLIAPMIRDAPSRVRRMVEAAAAPHRSVTNTRALVASNAEDDVRAVRPAPVRRLDAWVATAPERIGGALVYAGSAEWETAGAVDAVAGPAQVAAPLGTVAPADASERLRRYAGRYPLAVATSTRDRIFAPALAALWASRAPRGLIFDVYAHSAMLGGAVHPHRLPRAIRDLLPPSYAGAEHVPGALAPDEVRGAIWQRFRDAVEVLARAEVLGAVLLRLPRHFAPDREHADTLRGWLGRLEGWAVGVEFANPEWASDRLRGRTAALLREHGATRVLGAGEPADPGEFAVMRGRLGIERVAQHAARIHVIP